jgi:hypothetical protein
LASQRIGGGVQRDAGREIVKILFVSTAACLAAALWALPANSASLAGNGGPCALAGSLGAAVTIPSSGSLKGDCAIVGNVISSGLISPGASGTGPGAQLGIPYIGTDSITGNLTLATGSNMQLEVSPTGGDLINVSGSLQLGGTIQIYTNGASLAGKVFIPLITSSSVNLLIPPSSSFVSFGGPIVDPATGDYLYSAQGIANILVPQSANLKPIELLGTSDVLELAPTLDSPLVAVYNRVTSIYDTIKIEGGLVNEQTAEVLSAIGYEREANPEFPALEALGEFIETAEPDMIAFGKATDSLPDLPDLPDPPVPTINPSGLINQTIAMTFNAIDANGQTLFNRLLTLRSDINSVQAAITANEPILDLVNQLSTDASNFVSLNKTQSALWKQVESELEAAGIPNFSITQSDIASYVGGLSR